MFHQQQDFHLIAGQSVRAGLYGLKHLQGHGIGHWLDGLRRIDGRLCPVVRCCGVIEEGRRCWHPLLLDQALGLIAGPLAVAAAFRPR